MQSLEDAQTIDKRTGQARHVTAAAISISGVEYVRISSQPINAEDPYYIYRTKDSKAGNPISLLYAETLKEKQNFLFGKWANSYFFSEGVTTAHIYSINEDLYETLWEDQTVCSKLPVQLIDSLTSANALIEPTEEIAQDTNAPTTPDTAEKATEAEEKDRFINLVMLTPRDGLPDTTIGLTGLLDNPSIPYVERTQRSNRINKFQASVFGNSGLIVLIPLGVLIVVGAAFAIYKKTSKKKASVTPKKTNIQSKSNNSNKTNKSSKQDKSKKFKKSR